MRCGRYGELKMVYGYASWGINCRDGRLGPPALLRPARLSTGDFCTVAPELLFDNYIYEEHMHAPDDAASKR